MASVHHITGYDSFIESIGKIAETAKELHVLFTGAKDAGGKSWCPDCNDAEPFLKKHCIEDVSSDSTFVIVDVGDRPTWKDMKNPFRLNKDTHLSVIPTLINWNEKTKRLEGDQLCKPELLAMFLEQE